ncbi:hypothetical protein [Streptomyces sp. NPDC088812]|uniref:hypothetical protein n=1 Tax=Streptomyces sp. NPDC088812 TaxID=3365905 RepID=UPI00380F1EB9
MPRPDGGPSSVPLRALPPHLRLLAWPGLNGRGGRTPLRVRVPDGRQDLPVPLLAQLDDVTVSVRQGPVSGAALLALLTSGRATPEMRPLLDIVVCMALWDETLRVQGVFDGNAYLASEGAVDALLGVAGARRSGTLTRHIEELQSFELLYRFPVAFKFRGAYGDERQCRLNGWGRLLFRHLVRADDIGLPLAEWRTAVERHVEDHREQYRTALACAVRAVDTAPGEAWETVKDLPVPVLM